MTSTTDRINQKMKELGLSQADVMRGTGAGRATVSGWINGSNAPSAKYLESLAKTLKTTSSWILNGKEDLDRKLDNSVSLDLVATVTYAPVISWVQAGDFTDMESISNLAECEKLPLVPGAGKRSFYLEVKGLSNAPYFEEGEKICIDPDYQLCDIHTGEMIVVKCNDTATFKALISESNGYYLKPLNPNWSEQVIPLNEDCVLVGKYVGSFKPSRKFNLS
ncbi:LexA family protein [Acinetobacter radioresistens]|uniref:LexA family protein n=1 Tax=Acinetobacter radioresistens TaxID=40216 RepID=UPI0020053AE3|nr:S24 family peptidase [Acinetobacter radioresistens]MCK4097538.1 helix-turn-helix domain-containing protein [Acinetobacter radioresistens]